MYTYTYVHIYIYINPPLKDGLTSSSRPDCQMCGPLAQLVVLNVVFLDSQPLLFLSKWVHRAGVASHLGGLRGSYSPRTSILTFSKKTCFSGMSFFMFFLRIAYQNHSKMYPNRNIGSSKMMLCRLFVVFSQTVFLNDPTVIWPPFHKLAAPWIWKTRAGKHLKPLWQHIVKKHAPKSHLGAKTTKKRPRLRSKWTTWPRTQLSHFHLGGSLGDTWALKSQKTRPRHADFMKSL